MKERKQFLTICIGIIIFLLAICTINFYVDPYFVYRKPKNNLYYSLNNQRYQNYGIIKNFDYNAAIIGTSMCQNYLNSEFDDLFNVNSIKICNSGGTLKENGDMCEYMLKENKDVIKILWGIDINTLICDENQVDYESLPTYLYDDSLLNDIKYLLNQRVLIESVNSLFKTPNKISFDDYCNFSRGNGNAKDVLSQYERPLIENKKKKLTDYEKEILINNINSNLLNKIEMNPNVTFYIFVSPYSLCFFDMKKRNGELCKIIDEIELLTEKIIDYKNVKLFLFFDDDNIMLNLDNYLDVYHYSGNVNSMLLMKMKNNENRLTKYNYSEYFNQLREKYNSLDYDMYIDNTKEN